MLLGSLVELVVRAHRVLGCVTPVVAVLLHHLFIVVQLLCLHLLKLSIVHKLALVHGLVLVRILKTYLRRRTALVTNAGLIVLDHVGYRTEEDLFCFVLLRVFDLRRPEAVCLYVIWLHVQRRQGVISEIPWWVVA